MNFPAWTYKSQNFVQSQLNCEPSHGGETVTLRNSAIQLCIVGLLAEGGRSVAVAVGVSDR